MNTEQKAKAYDEAKARMSRAYNSNRCTIGFMNEIFPELKESNDEKIRKWLIDTLKGYHHLFEEGGVTKKDMLSWLEKQGNQKPTDNDMVEALRTEYEKGRADAFAQMQKEWGSEDSFILKSAIALLKHPVLIEKNEDIKNRVIQWLKSLIPQSKQKWSEEDERIYKVILELMDSYSKGTIGGYIISPNTDKYIKWFKSIKDRVQPQSKWSEEDYAMIEAAINLAHEYGRHGLWVWLKSIKQRIGG